MSDNHLQCPLAGRISSDFHELIKGNCERCRESRGQCLIELILTVRGDVEEELPRYH